VNRAVVKAYTGPAGDILWKVAGDWSEFHATDAVPIYTPSPQGFVTSFMSGYTTERDATAALDNYAPPVFMR
jgi:hypothetical protein